MVVGGGSAGHVVPAIPVIERLAAEGAHVDFVGTRSGLEEGLVEALPVAFHAISAGKLRRYLSLENLTDLFRIVAGIWQAWRLVGRLRPDVVFSKGGFVAFPVAVAAWLRRTPVVAHESDLTPGLANRLSMPFVATLCTSFAETRFKGFKGRQVHTGSPLRPELLVGRAEAGRALLELSGDKPMLLVTGGSLGADALNRIVREAAEDLVQAFDIVHVCGAGKLADASIAGYQQHEYFGAGWGDVLAAADVVVSRAGANALFELLALRKPCLLVPLSARASRGDQIENARYAASRGLVHVVQEADLTADVLCAEVRRVHDERDALVEALQAFETPDAVARLCEEIRRAARC